MAPRLDERHRKSLEVDSGISAAIHEARGYQTIRRGAEKALAARGFASGQRRVPGLLIPRWDVSGKPLSPQYRPDDPRKNKDGKDVKYESVPGSTSVLDVPPSVREMALDPSVTLYLTEGCKKADAAAARGMCCLALSGVWNFRVENEKGVRGLLPDFKHIPLEGRLVVVCYDSDVMQKPGVRLALEVLTEELRKRGAIVLWGILDAADGEKIGLDDYLAKGGRPEDIRMVKPEDMPKTHETEGRKEKGRQAGRRDRTDRVRGRSCDLKGPHGRAARDVPQRAEPRKRPVLECRVRGLPSPRL